MRKLLLLLLLSTPVFAGDNHVHVEQVGNGGDNVDLTIDQIGYDNLINFSFAHQNNVFEFMQSGSGNSISWVPYWGSGKSWGGDVDGTGNSEDIAQYDGATYGRHIWGNNNTVEVYQDGEHTHYLDIHASSVEVDTHQEGSGEHYSHAYFYGTTSNSEVNITQKDNANHNAQIKIQGNQPTTLNLTQQGSTNQSYNLTQTCYTTGGCTVNVTQGN
tara:strand:- start:2399 stop:3043 length:645 start_codon:yes stop_codon:yes gene_type:complete